jgi:hypothetical protein
MTDARTAWGEVADQITSLALKIKLHAEEEYSEAELKQKCGFERLAAVADETVDAIEDAFEDAAVRENAREVARALREAIDVTVTDVQRRVRTG